MHNFHKLILAFKRRRDIFAANEKLLLRAYVRFKVQHFQMKRFKDTILIKFLIKTNSVTFKDHSSCPLRVCPRIETRFFSPLPYFLSLGREETLPPFLTTDTTPLVHDPLIKRTRLDGGRKFEDRSPGLLFAFSTLCHRHPRNNSLRQASSNYLPQSLLNHADCRPHATDKFSCRDTLNFASTSYFPSIATFFVPLELRTNIIPLIVLLPFFPIESLSKGNWYKRFLKVWKI